VAVNLPRTKIEWILQNLRAKLLGIERGRKSMRKQS